MWYIDGEKHVPGEYCDNCKCYVEAAYFYEIMFYKIPKWTTLFLPQQEEEFRDIY